MTCLYEIRDLDFDYQLGEKSVRALSEVSFDIAAGDFLCLAGPSGSGKSTLLNVIGLIERVQQGRVLFHGDALEALPESKKNDIRRHELAFVFQRFHLLPVLTSSENVEYFLIRQGVPRKERKARIREALEAVGVWDQRDKWPSQMSGGEQQRVAVARAIAKQPRVIIADEPTASLDQRNGSEIMRILKALNRDKGVTVIIASHDRMVLDQAGTLVTMRDGRITDVDRRGKGT